MSTSSTSPVSIKEQKEQAFKAKVALGVDKIRENLNGAKNAEKNAQDYLDKVKNELSAAMNAGNFEEVMRHSGRVTDATASLKRFSDSVTNWQNALTVASGGEVTKPKSNKGRSIIMTEALNKAKSVIEREFASQKSLSAAIPDMEKRSWVITPNSDGTFSVMLRTIQNNQPTTTSTSNGRSGERITNVYTIKADYGGGERTSVNRIIKGTGVYDPIPLNNGETETEFIHRVCETINGVDPENYSVNKVGDNLVLVKN